MFYPRAQISFARPSGGKHGMVKCRRLTFLASLCLGVAAISCANDSAPPDPSGTDVIAGALVNIQNTWEDGTNQGWIPRGGGVVLTNTTEQALAGTRSLKTTNRTATFHGPSLNLTSQLQKGATYQVSVGVRLVAGQAATTIRMTMQRTLVGGTQQFDTIAQNTNVTDAAWVT